MQGKMLIYRPDAPLPEQRTLTGPLDADMLRDVIGGYLERVPLWLKLNGAECVALCDEESKIKDKPVNVAATAEWQRAQPFPVDDVLVGTVVVLTGDDDFMQSL